MSSAKDVIVFLEPSGEKGRRSTGARSTEGAGSPPHLGGSAVSALAVGA